MTTKIKAGVSIVGFRVESYDSYLPPNAFTNLSADLGFVTEVEKVERHPCFHKYTNCFDLLIVVEQLVLFMVVAGLPITGHFQLNLTKQPVEVGLTQLTSSEACAARVASYQLPYVCSSYR